LANIEKLFLSKQKRLTPLERNMLNTGVQNFVWYLFFEGIAWLLSWTLLFVSLQDCWFALVLRMAFTCTMTAATAGTLVLIQVVLSLQLFHAMDYFMYLVGFLGLLKLCIWKHLVVFSNYLYFSLPAVRNVFYSFFT